MPPYSPCKTPKLVRSNCKITEAHWNVILDFMEENRDFATGKLGHRQGYRKFWADLTERLNATGFGAKSMEKWQKTWTDFKCTLKKKAIRVWKTELMGNDGPDSIKRFTPIELKVLTILGDSFYKGYNNNSTLDGSEPSACSSMNRSRSRPRRKRRGDDDEEEDDDDDDDDDDDENYETIIEEPKKRSFSMCEEDDNDDNNYNDNTGGDNEMHQTDDHEYIVLRNVDDYSNTKRLKRGVIKEDHDDDNPLINHNRSNNEDTPALLQAINDTIDHRLLGIQRSIDKLTNAIKTNNQNCVTISKVAETMLTAVSSLVGALQDNHK